MLRYVIHTEELYELLGTLYDVLGIAISFYDIDFNELSFFDSSKQKPYCKNRRQDKSFYNACKLCDRKYFDRAKLTKKIQLYTCHANLIDGIIPIYDDNKKFLGTIVFGQVRPEGQKNPHKKNTKLWQDYEEMPTLSLQKFKQIGRLLQLTTEMIVRHRMIAFKNLSWIEKLESYIEAHISERITISTLAQLIQRSPSFVSHYFKRELGTSPANYIQEKRMAIAKKMLENGEQVTAVAEKLGYYDAFHFSKVFKKYFGKPPLFFRSAVKSKQKND